MPWSHEELFESEQKLVFGDYAKMGVPRDDRRYEEIADTGKLPQLFADYLDEYNPENKEMRLVFFWDAIDHVSRLARVLRQPRGNAMLVGVGGSGKQSLTRFASFMAEMRCFQVTWRRHSTPTHPSQRMRPRRRQPRPTRDDTLRSRARPHSPLRVRSSSRRAMATLSSART